MENYLIEKPTSQIDGKNASILLTNSLGYFFAIVDKYPNVQSGKWWCIGMGICTGINAGNVGKYKVIVVSDIKNYAVVGDGYTDSYGGKEMALNGYTESFEYNGQTLYVGVPETTIGVAYTDAKVPIYDGEVFSDMKIAAKKLVDLYAESGGELPWEQSYSKVEYSRINWVDEEVSHETPIDANNLNKMDKAIEELCNNLDIAHTEIGNKAASSEIPTKVSQLNNDSDYQTETQVKSTVSSEVAKIVADAPEDYDTLKEISDWISGHESDASAMNSAIKANTKAIENKVDKVDGKGLSTNDYTTSDKEKLAGIETGANKTVVDDVLSDTSENPVQNKVVKASIEKVVNDIEIGGRNLLIGTKEFQVTNAKSFGTSLSNITSETYRGLVVRYKSGAWNFYRPVFTLGVGTYTFSTYARGTSGIQAVISAYGNGSALSRKQIQMTEDWTRYIISFSVSTDMDVDLALELSETGDLYECGWKLEKGNKATDWTPAPEDIESQIDTKADKNGFGNLAGGKNLFDEEYTDIKSGSLTYKSLYVGDGAFTMSTTAPLNSKSGAILFFLPGKVTSGASTSTNGVYATKSRTVTAVDGYVTIGYRIDELNPDDYNAQIEYGKEKTTYEPYFPSNKMLSEENAKQSTEMMTIKMLGWSVPRECPIQNEVNGNQFVQKVGRVDLGTLNWVYDATSGHERFRTADVVLSFIKPSQINGIPANIYTNGYTTNSANGTYLHANDKGISVDTDSVIWVYDSTYTDATAFKSAMEGQYLYYELAAPIITTIDGNEIGETVDDLEEKLDKFTQKIVTRRVQLVKDPVSDYDRTIFPISDEPYVSVPRFIVQGGYSTFGPDPDDEQVVGGESYTCAEKAAVKFDILTPEINGSITQGGITVTYNANGKSYTIKGAAEDDIEIPLYSVSTPRDNTLRFRSTNLRQMSSTKYYIKISDAGGSNEVTIGEDDSKKETASLKTHVGKVTVYLVVKAGTNRFSSINVRAGYSLAHEIADYSPNKYSDTVDNVIDAILDLDSRLKVLENK